MGLAEKRWVLERKTNDEAPLKAKLTEAAGKDVPLEIDWEAFSAKMDDCGYISNESYGIPQLIQAIAKVTVDDLGKEAIKGGLKKVVIKPAASNDATSFTFVDGVVTWNAYFGSSSGGYIYADEMTKTIEKAL